MQHNLSCATWGEVKKLARYDWAILPWGSTEPHNGHLPYGTDVICSSGIACRVAEGLAKAGINAMALPGVPFGAQNPGQTGLPFCLHTRQETQMAILRDIVASLKRQGIGRLLIINGHGGNSFKGMVRDLTVEDPSFLILTSDWYTVLPRQEYFEADIDDHAGEQETSVVMYLRPELVKMEYAGTGESKSFGIEGLRNHVAWHPRDWSRVSVDTGIGNPAKASADKGKRYVEDCVALYVQMLREITEKGDLY
ncbi:MAG: creatininase family protein [Bacteroidales bacterium]|nr:creatininase family protein [Bacteroidales bacterium]